MLEGKRINEWSHTSHILCMMHNKDAKTPKQVKDFNPYFDMDNEEPRGKLMKIGVGMLKGFLSK